MMKDRTIDYYDNNSEDFIQTTKDVEFSETQDKFIKELKNQFSHEQISLLDFGCGSGRDTKYFLEKGFLVDAIDGSKEMCKFASTYTGIEVEHTSFQKYKTEKKFEGVWACSSILHLNKSDLEEVFKKLASMLKENGILYTSFKYSDFEGERNGRYFTDFTSESFAQFNEKLGYFEISKEWVTSDVRPGREGEKWLNLLLKKI